jgi:hypothetical protein
MSNHDEDEESGGGIFDALDAEEEEEETGLVETSEMRTSNNNNNNPRVSLYRVPVNLYKNEDSGEQYFYLQKGTFPNRSITDLKIIYTQKEKDQVREQVLADSNCPQVVLKKVQVECCLGGKSENDDPMEYLNDESFRLSGSKIEAIRMRMYAKQKMEAQKQLEDPSCDKITLYLDIECRLGSRGSQQ